MTTSTAPAVALHQTAHDLRKTADLLTLLADHLDKTAKDVDQRTDRVNDGGILARLQALDDRLEAVHDRAAVTLADIEAAERIMQRINHDAQSRAQEGPLS